MGLRISPFRASKKFEFKVHEDRAEAEIQNEPRARSQRAVLLLFACWHRKAGRPRALSQPRDLPVSLLYLLLGPTQALRAGAS